jgi:hypothetical protein
MDSGKLSECDKKSIDVGDWISDVAALSFITSKPLVHDNDPGVDSPNPEVRVPGALVGNGNEVVNALNGDDRSSEYPLILLLAKTRAVDPNNP